MPRRAAPMTHSLFISHRVFRVRREISSALAKIKGDREKTKKKERELRFRNESGLSPMKSKRNRKFEIEMGLLQARLHEFRHC